MTKLPDEIIVLLTELQPWIREKMGDIHINDPMYCISINAQISPIVGSCGGDILVPQVYDPFNPDRCLLGWLEQDFKFYGPNSEGYHMLHRTSGLEFNEQDMLTVMLKALKWQIEQEAKNDQ